jgi:hypothetical protein
MHIGTTQHGHHEGRTRHVERGPGQYALCGRVEDLEVGEQETNADDQPDGGEPGQHTQHLTAFHARRRLRALRGNT